VAWAKACRPPEFGGLGMIFKRWDKHKATKDEMALVAEG
jgi:hypothetical protein